MQFPVSVYNLIFKPYHLSSPLAPLWGGEIVICPRRLFCPKFYVKKLLFEAFFRIMCIFDSAQPKSECNFPFLYDLIFQLNTGDNHVESRHDYKWRMSTHMLFWCLSSAGLGMPHDLNVYLRFAGWRFTARCYGKRQSFETSISPMFI